MDHTVPFECGGGGRTGSGGENGVVSECSDNCQDDGVLHGQLNQEDVPDFTGQEENCSARMVDCRRRRTGCGGMWQRMQ